jgi:hypothetical protein
MNGSGQPARRAYEEAQYVFPRTVFHVTVDKAMSARSLGTTGRNNLKYGVVPTVPSENPEIVHKSYWSLRTFPEPRYATGPTPSWSVGRT